MSETITATPVAAVEPAAAPVAPASAPPVPVSDASPAPAAAPVEAAPETVLGAPPVTEPTAPVEAEAAPDAAPVVEGQSAEPAPLPTFDAFKLPEGMAFDQERIGEFTGLLGQFESKTKADHAEVQALGQQLLDRHVSEVQGAIESLNKAYMEKWAEQKVAWKDQFLQDPEIGGNRFQTTVDSANSFIRTHGGTEAQQAEFRALMESSGLGNHPAMIRILAKAGASMSEGRPLAAQAPAPAPKSKVETLYGGR